MKQHELVTRHNLLDSNGHLIENGWSRDLILAYNRESVIQKSKLKEWEYYLVSNGHFAFAISIAFVGSVSRVSVHWLDFDHKTFTCKSDFVPDSEYSLSMPADINGDVIFLSKRSTARYIRTGRDTQIMIEMQDFSDSKPIKASIRIHNPETDKMVIVVPYYDPELFYYNYKAACMPVEGFVEYDGQKYNFDTTNSMGTYDWGRGIWEDVNQWYWGSAGTMLNGKTFGFNIGNGFGQNLRASENVIFFDGVGHKIQNVKFVIPNDVVGNLRHIVEDKDFLSPWIFESSDHRLDMAFVPVINRASNVCMKDGYYSGQNQVFGYYSGCAVLDNGERLEFKDVFGFAEKVGNVWTN